MAALDYAFRSCYEKLAGLTGLFYFTANPTARIPAAMAQVSRCRFSLDCFFVISFI